MIRFLLKGLLRDRHRSLFPVIIIATGVMISIFMFCFMHGMADDMIRSNAKLDTGHVKIRTRGYDEFANQLPNDLGLTGVGGLLEDLRRDFPDMEWAARIRFAGLIDIPDQQGETRSQGPAIGMAVDLLGNGGDRERLGFEEAIVRGRMPEAPGEILISDDFATLLEAGIGDVATLIGSTSTGSMAIHNFVIAGTVRFGIAMLDRNMIIADLADVQYALDMEDGCSEVLGFIPSLVFDRREAERVQSEFNARHAGVESDFTPIMLTLRDQNGLGQMLDLVSIRTAIILLIFFVIMSIVLWNTGLMSGIRRYGEIGVRLAIGESKFGVYTKMLVESLLIGVIGTVIGTAIGAGISLYFQEHGFDFSNMIQGSRVLMANVIRAKVTPTSYVIGFIPGLGATFFGSAFAGYGIFKRRTAQLFKELEA